MSEDMKEKPSDLLLIGARRWTERGLQLIEKEEYDRALDAFYRAYALTPDTPEVVVNLAQELYLQGKVEESEQVIRKGLKTTPNTEFYKLLTRILLEDDDRRAEAKAIIQEASLRCDDSSQTQLLEAFYALETEDTEKACKLFNSVLEHDPDNEEAFEGLCQAVNLVGISLSEEGKIEEALFILKHTIDLDPEWSAPHVNIGNCFKALGLTARARESYLNAIDLDPDNPQAHFNLGGLYLDEDNFDSAEYEFKTVLEVDPEYPDVNAELGRIYSLQGKFELASEAFSNEIAVNPDCVSCICNLAISYFCSGKDDIGEDLLINAVEKYNDPFAMYTLAGLYSAKKQFSRALDLLEKTATFQSPRLKDYMLNDIKFTPLLTDPRFIAVLDSM